MQVFNLYFKVLRKYLGMIFMYIGIFSGLLVGILVPQMTKDGGNSFEKFENDFVVFDYDNSSLSVALTEYLSEKHNLKAGFEDSKEKIQDELYEQSVHSVIRFEAGFQDAFVDSDTSKYPEVYAIPGSKFEMLFEQDVNAFLSVVKTYTATGFEIEEAIEKTIEATNETVEVEMIDAEASEGEGPLHYFFKYLCWIFIAACVSSVTIALLSLNKKGLRERIECSSYKFSRMNMEIIAGVVVTGLAICAIFALIACISFPSEMFTIKGILYVINSVCFMAVALAITFLVSKLTDNPQVISLMSNVISLGMAFLCGVFVPLELLSKPVIRIAHCLPAYWNVRAISVVDSFKSEDLPKFMLYCGIQILFAAFISATGIIVASKKRQKTA